MFKIIFDKNSRIDFITFIDYHPFEIKKTDTKRIKQYRKNRLKDSALCAYRIKFKQESESKFLTNALKSMEKASRKNRHIIRKVKIRKSAFDIYKSYFRDLF